MKTEQEIKERLRILEEMQSKMLSQKENLTTLEENTEIRIDSGILTLKWVLQNGN